MANTAQHIVLAGGGTAGHLFPGLAVAAEIKATSRAAAHYVCGQWEIV